MRSDWRDRAACRDVDPELFFPVGTSGPAQAQVAEAKAVCAICPVVADCLAFALDVLPDGVAGGLTVAERAQLRAAAPLHRHETSRRPVADRRETAARLRGRGWPASAIADQLGVNERTVYRLLRGAA